MREILFRGKMLDTNKWVKGDLIRDYKTRTYCIKPRKEVVAHYPVDKETVGQFTGLTDKNGTKIFEGDILQRNNRWNSGGVAEVKANIWNCGCCHAVYGFSTEDNSISLSDDAIEVIGNIHDNPELIGGK